jgi:hypothetical protein
MKNFSLINIVKGNLKESSTKKIKGKVDSELEEIRGLRAGTNVGKEVGLAADFASLSTTTKNAFKDMEVAIGLQGNPIKVGNKSLSTADDIFTAIKDGSLKSGKEMARVEKGFLKSANTSPSLRKSIATDFAKDASVLDDFVKNNKTTTKEISDYLKSKGYADESIKEIIAQMKSNGTITNGKLVIQDGKAVVGGKPVGGGKNKTQPNPLPAPQNKTLLDRIRELKNFRNWPTAVKWAAGLGITAAGLWAFCMLNGVVFPDIPETQPEDTGEWPGCIKKLIQSGEGTVVTKDDGSVSVEAKYGPYPDGVSFTNDGRVKDLSTSRMGTWSCEGGQIATNESKIITLIKGVLSEIKLNEQIDEELSNDVETMIDLLDFPVSQSDLISAGALLKTYVDNGKGDEFLTLYQQSGFGSGDLKTSLKYIVTTNPKSVQAKQNLVNLISQIESGTSTSTTEDGTDSSEIKIVWDNEDEDSVTPIPKRQFYDCNDKPLPHEFGCKSEQIRKLQKCLGDVKADSAFGPLTKGSLEKRNIDTSNGITQGIIDTVCGSTDTTTTPERTRLEPIELPKRESPFVPIDPSKFKLPNISALEVTPVKFYTALKDNGNIVGLEGGNRIKYKGPDLDQTQLGKLDIAIETMGYTRIKNLEDLKPYGSKYVWKKIS